MQNARMHRTSILAFVLIVGIYVGNAGLVAAFRPADGRITGLRLASWWIVISTVLVMVTRVERLPLASIGLKPVGPDTLGWGAGMFVVAFLISGLVARLLMPALGVGQDGGQAMRIAAQPVVLQLALFATAAVVEELVCRGFIISRLAPFSPALAVAASVALFMLPHMFGWKPAQLLFVAPLGIVFALFFLWCRDLPACIIAHFLVDTAGFMLMRLPR
jgi:membrane protease YdiL (CAAX protease family)